MQLLFRCSEPAVLPTGSNGSSRADARGRTDEGNAGGALVEVHADSPVEQGDLPSDDAAEYLGTEQNFSGWRRDGADKDPPLLTWMS